MAVTIPGVPTFNATTMSVPAQDAFAITTSDTVNFNAWARGIYVGVTGDVVIVTPANHAITFKNAQAGSIIPVACGRVNATSTTATNLVGLV